MRSKIIFKNKLRDKKKLLEISEFLNIFYERVIFYGYLINFIRRFFDIIETRFSFALVRSVQFIAQ